MDIQELKKKLIEHKCPVGPIDERNRFVYERRLIKLTMNISQGVSNDENRNFF